MKRLLLTLLLLPAIAWGQTISGGSGGGGVSWSSPSSTPIAMPDGSWQFQAGTEPANVYCDAQSQNMLVTTTTSNGNVTLVNGPGFSSADVGKTITINGAGASGAVLQTTISAVSSATAITLAATPGTALTTVVKWVWWGHDNATAINAALQAAPTLTSREPVQLPPGTCGVGSSLNLPAWTTLQGSGNYATFVQGIPGTSNAILQTVGYQALQTDGMLASLAQVTTATGSIGASSITVAAATNIAIGQAVSAPGFIPPGVTVSNVAGTTISLTGGTLSGAMSSTSVTFTRAGTGSQGSTTLTVDAATHVTQGALVYAPGFITPGTFIVSTSSNVATLSAPIIQAMNNTSVIFSTPYGQQVMNLTFDGNSSQRSLNGVNGDVVDIYGPDNLFRDVNVINSPRVGISLAGTTGVDAGYLPPSLSYSSHYDHVRVFVAVQTGIYNSGTSDNMFTNIVIGQAGRYGFFNNESRTFLDNFHIWGCTSASFAGVYSQASIQVWNGEIETCAGPALDIEATNGSVANLVMFSNNGGIIWNGANGNLTHVNITTDLGNSLTVNSSGSVTVSNFDSFSNTGKGIVYNSALPSRMTDLFINGNSNTGIDLSGASSVSGVQMSGRVYNNTGTEVVFGTALGNNNHFDLSINTSAGQTAWTGTLGCAHGYFAITTDGVSINDYNCQVNTPNLFGSGADGNLTINSGTTTLTRDMAYNNLTLSGTGVLNTAGYQVYVAGTLDISNAQAGAIILNGAAGNNGSGATGGASKSAASVGTVLSGLSSGTGGTGNTTTGSGTTAGSCLFFDAANGGAGGTGGTGVSAGATGGGNGTSATVPPTLSSPLMYNVFATYNNSGYVGQYAGCGGGGGGNGGGDGTNAGGGGGSGALSGGMIVIHAATINRGASTGVGAIAAKGGTGGTGAAGVAGTAGGGGGGGGGSGGAIQIVVGSLTGASATTALDASGGTGGAGGAGASTGKGGVGGNGGNGGVIAVQILYPPSFTISTFNPAGSSGTNTGTSSGGAGGAGDTQQSNL